jgi:7-keto-8-aminopelargonate synthetase-like enzyme
LGKALGGASGGYTSGRKEIIDLLRQRSRPYLFSNSVAGQAGTFQIVDAMLDMRRKLFPYFALSSRAMQESVAEGAKVSNELHIFLRSCHFLAQTLATRRRPQTKQCGNGQIEGARKNLGSASHTPS